MLPFVVHLTGLTSPFNHSCNSFTVEEPLPPVVQLKDGYVQSLATRITEVSQETTDDN